VHGLNQHEDADGQDDNHRQLPLPVWALILEMKFAGSNATAYPQVEFGEQQTGQCKQANGCHKYDRENVNDRRAKQLDLSHYALPQEY
jgi:hypothetical protein